MTLSTSDNTQSYTGDGSTTEFSFPYLFYADGDLDVYLDGTLQTITTHYTVSGAGNSNGGTVTFVTAPPNGDSVIIQRTVDLLQETDLENFDGNPADVTEKQFDLLVMADQQIDEKTDRAILAPLGTSLTSNNISGTIDSTSRVLTITTSGPAATALADLDTSLDVVLTGEASGDFLRYDGTNWVNVTEIDTDDLADDAVTLAKMAGGTDGNLITFDANGDPAYVATGTSGQVLTSNGAGAAPTFQDLSPGLELLETQTAADDASIDFTSNIDDTYEKYIIEFNDVIPATDGQQLRVRTSTDAANFDTGASDYEFTQTYQASSAASATDNESTGSNYVPITHTTGSAAGENCSGTLEIYAPASASFTAFSCRSVGFDASGNLYRNLSGGARKAAEDVNGIRLYFGSGNITSGEFKLYGVKKS